MMAHFITTTSLVDLRALCLRCISEGWDSRKISKEVVSSPSVAPPAGHCHC